MDDKVATGQLRLRAFDRLVRTEMSGDKQSRSQKNSDRENFHVDGWSTQCDEESLKGLGHILDGRFDLLKKD